MGEPKEPWVCQCEPVKPGDRFHCPHLDRAQTSRGQTICSGSAGGTLQRLYVLKWKNDRGKRGVAPAEPTVKAPDHGPGTELTKLIESLGLKSQGCNGCRVIAAEMNNLGVEGCLAMRDYVVDRLRKKQQQLSWMETLRAAAGAVLTGLAFKIDPSDPAPGLFDEAVRRAKEKIH